MRHQAVLGDVTCEPPTQMCLSLKLIIERPMVVVGMRENAIDSSSHGAESLYRVLFD